MYTNKYKVPTINSQMVCVKFRFFSLIVLYFFRFLKVEYSHVTQLQKGESNTTSNRFQSADQIFCDCTLHFLESNATNISNITKIKMYLESFHYTI